MRLPAIFVYCAVLLNFSHVVGPDAERVNPIFLNLMQHITTRAGKAWVRVGGNSQDRASLVMEGLPGGAALEKLDTLSNSTVSAPRFDSSNAS